MKKLYILFIGLLVSGGVMAQSCLPEGIIFDTQAQIDSFQINFPNCTEIEGDVVIRHDVINLNGLSVLTSVGGDLSIRNLSNLLTDLSGLDNLQSIMGELFVNNTGITSLHGLEGLTFIGGSLRIWTNGDLTSLSGLQNLQTISGDCNIQGNWILENLIGLENITSIGGTLEITDNTLLSSFSGLENLSTISGNFWIGHYILGSNGGVIGNPSLTTLDALESLTSIGGSLQILANTSLTNLSGLNNIEAGTINILNISENPSLSQCDILSICDYLANPNDTIIIHDNATGCNSQEEVEDDCANNCLPDGITFTSQSQIDSFQIIYPNCTEIEGYVIIGGYWAGTNITNLTGINVLTSIGGNLIIGSNGALTNLTGLENLTSIGGNLWIGDSYNGNSTLTSLIGLDNLAYIGEDLQIDGNVDLTSLTGLENLTSLLGNLTISSNGALTSLAGLDNLTSIGGSLGIWLNHALTSLTGLDNMTSIGGFLSIGHSYEGGNLVLTSLSGLEGLTSIGEGLWINGNHALTSITGLQNIDAVSINSLYIYDNNSLSTCEVKSVCDYIANPSGVIEIHENSVGCDTQEEVEEACDALPCLPDGITFSTQAQIDSFQINYPNCTEIEGDVTICGYIGCGNAITNLNGLSVLNVIKGHLGIYYNNNLLSLTGLDNLTSIGGGLTINDNIGLSSLSGLGNLDTIIGNFYFAANSNLLNLTGLDNLTYIGGRLTFGDTDGYGTALVSFTGLEELTHIGGGLNIEHNPSLTTLTGLEGLNAINGELIIGNCWDQSNYNLTNLIGLGNIEAGTISNLSITCNPLLSTCEIQSICDYLVSPNGTIEIFDNAMGCNSQKEVEEACVAGLDEIGNFENHLIIYPNPSSSQITIELSSTPQKNTSLTIYNLNGQQLLTQRITEPKTVVDVSGLPKGVYFVKVVDDERVMMGKVIKQ